VGCVRNHFMALSGWVAYEVVDVQFDVAMCGFRGW
jgi:hypothetical protein